MFITKTVHIRLKLFLPVFKRRNIMYNEIVCAIRKNHYQPDTVKEAANLILQKTDGQIPVKIVNICKQMGFSVYRQELPPKVCGYIVINGELKDDFKTDRIISVNENESNKRRRFTVAHELAHYLFDFNPEQEIQYFNRFELDHEKGKPEEDLANRFAAELLMPEADMRSRYCKLNDGNCSYYDIVQSLSDEFLVPPKAIDVRLKEELKLVESCDGI